MDYLRSNLLMKLWDRKVEKLITLYEKNQKRHYLIINRLKTIDKNRKAVMIHKYYKDAKKQYVVSIGKWLQSLKAAGIVTYAIIIV